MTTERIPSQMLKGILEGAILIIIGQGETYGYALHEALNRLGFGDIPEGTIYPLLLKMQRNNQIVGVRHPSTTGPDRKYYHLSATGEQDAIAFTRQWQQLAAAMDQLTEGSEPREDED
ncbi:MAG: PadR family transcriptional regulator [Schleiferilactobacillus perolens]|jgi:PadR family transcriptional regulator PadR|uniref:PadR family transcriptional regulator n=1 Tax=Schleiferilactobacillus perolens TaxID=100468 RepID=UPI0039E8EFDF|nr:PadR family transcriptional regulator [Schleiferilactobacillus harbinensis]MCI1913766.1 PadR family transcriptional regulator [Schleiferilactobacillus harbinensis]